MSDNSNNNIDKSILSSTIGRGQDDPLEKSPPPDQPINVIKQQIESQHNNHNINNNNNDDVNNNNNNNIKQQDKEISNNININNSNVYNHMHHLSHRHESPLNLSRSVPNLSHLMRAKEKDSVGVGSSGLSGGSRVGSGTNSINSSGSSITDTTTVIPQSSNTANITVTITNRESKSNLLNQQNNNNDNNNKSISNNISNSTPISSSSTTTTTSNSIPINHKLSQSHNHIGFSHGHLEDEMAPTLGSLSKSHLIHKQTFEEQGTLVSGIRPTRAGRIFDHFIVVGLPSDIDLKCSAHDEKQKHAPQVLYQYPKDESLPNDMIAEFCFPNQVTSRSAQRSSSYSTLNQVAFCNLTHLLNTEHSFVFLLNTSSTLYYGVCIVKEEEVCSYPSFIPKPVKKQDNTNTTTDTSNNTNNNNNDNDSDGIQSPIESTSPPTSTNKRSLNRSHYDFIAPRVYCFLTRFPFFQLHFQMLHSILERERMLMLFSMTETQDPALSMDTMEIIDMYYNISMEGVKDKVVFKTPGQDYKTDFHCPYGSEDRLIGDWSLFSTFECGLSIEDILSVFSWCLMERSILVYSKHLGNISSFIFSFIPLLKPYVWQCCFIPILPESLLESIDAPFPFMMGISELPTYILTMKRDYLIVDIDSKKLIYPDSQIPHLPGTKKLVETLTNHRKESFKLQNKIPYEHLKNKYVQDIISTFRDYHSWLVDQISTAIITCINNIYLESLYISNNSQNNNNNQNTNNNGNNGSSSNPIPIIKDKEKDNNNNGNNGSGSGSYNNNQPTLMMSGEKSPPPQIDGQASIELLNKQSIHFLEDHLKQVIQCLPDNYRTFFDHFFHTQMFQVNAVHMMLITQERHKTNIGQIEKLESLIQMEEKSKEVLMEYQKMAKKDNKDINIIKQQLKDSEGVINELRESKKKLEMEALAMSPNKSNSSILPSFLGLSEIRKKKLEFGHRRTRSVSDQVEKNILKKSMKPPAASIFEMPTTPGRSNLSRSQSPLSVNSTSLLDLLEKEQQAQQQALQQQQQSQLAIDNDQREGYEELPTSPSSFQSSPK